MYWRVVLFIICCSVSGLIHGQTTESVKLLKQAEQIANSNPKESNSIAKLILKNAKEASTRIEALYVSGLSMYLSGHYDAALNELYDAKALIESQKAKSHHAKCELLISRILRTLKLETDSTFGEVENPIFRSEDYFAQGSEALLQNNFEAAEDFAGRTKLLVDFSNPGYLGALYYGLQGDIFFNKKAFETSLQYYQQAIDAAKQLENPFLNQLFYDQAAANYLALDSLNHFHKYSEQSKTMAKIASQIETRASNEAHRLNILELDKAYDSKADRLKMWAFILFAVTLVLGILKTVLFFKNRNKLNTYEQLLNYLRIQQQENTAKEHDETPVAHIEKEDDKPVFSHQHRASSLLKESEERILEDLEKFETTHKFTHKDMSLSKLATQLHTNTKYLSEVINRHKGKNFNSYINELRINYITSKIKNDTAYLKYKVSYLADECGYSSHSTFTTVFKSIVGISPIAFVDFVKDELNKEETAA